MPTTIHPVRVNHVNLVLEDFDASTAHLARVFGAQFLRDLPNPAWHACLIDIGRVIFEVFVPHDFFLSSRMGPHHFGIEFQADMPEVRAALDERGIRVARELGVAVHTDPRDSYGIAFEFYEGYFHDNEDLLGVAMQPAQHWLDQPLGLTGLTTCTIAVRDLDVAGPWFQSFLASEVLVEEDRPALGARALGLQVADGGLELLAPTGNGPLTEHLFRQGEGLRSTVLQVRDLDAAVAHLATFDIDVVDGSAPGRVALPTEGNLGVLFELSE